MTRPPSTFPVRRILLPLLARQFNREAGLHRGQRQDLDLFSLVGHEIERALDSAV